jgi:predicted ribonuclease YlaK
MASSNKRQKHSALLHEIAPVEHSDTRPSGFERRVEQVENEERRNRHQPVVSNALRLKLDHLTTLTPLTDNQAKFVEMYNRGDYFIGCFGSAGTGKTTMPMYKAIEEVLRKDNSFERVVVVRSSVQSGRDVGFLPGSLEEKMEVFELPYKEICQMLFKRADAWDRLKEAGHARFLSTMALRGISLDDSIIIADEIQNFNWSEIYTLMTRVGHRSKVIFCGDFRQTDLIHSKTDKSAFQDFIKVARAMKHFSEVYYTPDDIVRSSLTKDWIVTCEEFGF